MRNEGLQEDDIQKVHTTAPDQLTDQELLLSRISAVDLVRKHSVGWDTEHPKCLFCGNSYRHRTEGIKLFRKVCTVSIKL